MTITFYASYSEAKDPRKDYIDSIEGPNWTYDNAHRMLGLLGLPYRMVELTGEVSIHDALRAVIRAKALFDELAPMYEREEVREKRYIGFALDRDGLKMRLEQFAEFAKLALEAGANSIYWA